MNEDFLNDKLKNNPRIKVLGNPYDEKPNGSISNAILILKRMRLAAKYERLLEPDIVYFSTYETRSFLFGLPLFKRPNRIVVVENYNIDYLTDISQRLAYKLYASRINHLVYEPIFKDYLLRNFQLPEEKIHVVPHIQYMREVSNKSYGEGIDIYDCIAISGSNDKQMIKEIIEEEERESFFTNNKIRCIIKCKDIQYQSEYLTVTKGFIPTDTYEEMYSKTTVVLVPFPLSYQNRMSGCIVDAFSHRKPVVSSKIKLAEFYAAKYGPCIRTANNVKDMLSAVKYLIYNKDKVHFNYEKFAHDHEEKEVGKALLIMINKIV